MTQHTYSEYECGQCGLPFHKTWQLGDPCSYCGSQEIVLSWGELED